MVVRGECGGSGWEEKKNRTQLSLQRGNRGGRANLGREEENYQEASATINEYLTGEEGNSCGGRKIVTKRKKSRATDKLSLLNQLNGSSSLLTADKEVG